MLEQSRNFFIKNLNLSCLALVMDFIKQYDSDIFGVLHGFERILFNGHFISFTNLWTEPSFKENKATH